MRYLKTLLVVLFAFLGTTAFAGKSEKLGSWVQDGGRYYLYNVSKKAYLGAGGSWSTHAWLESVPGNVVQLVKVDGGYRIKTFSKGNSNNYLGQDGSDPWMDKNTNYNVLFTFTEVEVEGFNVGYVISHSAGNLGTPSDAADYKVLFGQSTENSTWVLISPDELNARLEGSISEEGVDATHLIKNPGFTTQTQHGDGFWNNGWVTTASEPTNNSWGPNVAGGTTNTGVPNEQAAEIWNGKFEIKQTLNSIPNGRYAATVYAFERVGNDKNRTDVDAYFYAGDQRAALNPINKHDASINTLDAAEKAMMAGNYLNGPITVDVTNNTLNIGLVNPTNQSYDWCVFNNYQLTYYGNLPLLEDLIEKSKALLPELDETNTAALTTAIAAAQKVADSNPDQAAILAAIDALQKAYNTADALNIAKAQAIDVLTQVPANLYPKDFFWYWELDEKGNIIPKQKADNIQKMELDRKYKVYKNNAGRYSLASRLVVASLIRLMQYADADAKTRKLISTRLAELGITGFDDSSKLADLLTQYSRLVVETHGVGAALEEQGDPNYSRMYDAIAQADLDTEEFIEFLLAGAAQNTDVYRRFFDAEEGSWVDNRTWVSNDGVLKGEVLTKDYDLPDPWYLYYIGLDAGDQVRLSIEDGLKMQDLTVYCRGTFTVDGGPEMTNNNDVSLDNKQEVLVDIVNCTDYSWGWAFYTTYTDSRTPWEKAGIDYTLSDVYELLHQELAEYYVQMDNYDYAKTFGTRYDYTAHILNPNLEDDAENWVITTSDPSRNPINNGQPLTASDGSQFNRYLDFWKGDGGFTFDANQTIDLPAGRYMLTVAGRASAAQLYETTLKLNDKEFEGLVYAGPFTEPSAADPTNYFQLYATVSNNGVTTHQSIVPQMGANDGIFGNGWNDASVFFTMPSDGKATIGVRAGTEDKGMWISATRFRLTRLGDATLYFDENETYDTELNWDPINFFFATAPTDVVLHKNLKAGHWQSIALPVDVSAQQLVNVFGEGTELAVPKNIYIHDMENQELIVDFESWDVLAAKEGPVQTKYYNYQYYANEFGYEYPTGMIANVPYLIKPAKVSSSNLYVFHDVKSSETHGSKDFLTDDGIWSWGSFNYTFGDETTPAGFSAQVVDEDFVELFGQIEFVPNYTYIPDFTDDFAVEFSDRSKAFSAKFVCPGDWKVVAAFMDGGFEIVTDQLNDMLALGQERSEWYPGLPDAMTKAMTTSPKVESESDVYGFVKYISNGTHSDDEKSWTSADGRITLTAEGDDAYVYNYEVVNTYFKHDSFNYQYLIFGPGKYTVKANNPGELIYGYQFNYMATSGDIKVTQENGEVVELPNTYGNFDPELSLSLGDNWTPELSFTVEGGEFAVPFFNFLLLYGADYTEYTDDEYFLIVDALKDAKTAISEAKKAYPAARAYHALYAEAEELLASDHVELVEGADAAFEKLLPNFEILFNRQTTTEGIVDVTERLQKAIDDFKTKVKFGGIQEGKNYLRNVATGKYLGAANNWGTQASLVKNPEFVTLAKLSDGVYTIETQVSNGGESYYLGANGFMDANPAIQVTFAPAGEYYTLTTAELGVLGYDGESNVLGKNLDAADENALWEVISEEDMLASLAEASLENPVNATFLIADANFGRNNRYLSAWQETHDGGGGNFNFRLAATDSDDGGAGCINNASEAWLCSFDVNQEIELPNGVYVLTAQAAITDYNNVGENFPVIYAGEESSPFIVMKEEDRGTYMRQLENAFLAGEYVVNPIVVNVTDGKLKIGARGTEAQKFWAIWDNFELTAYGDADIEAVRASLATTGSGEATGIKDVNAADGKTVIYTINGVRVNSISRPGIYIVNGKKVMVK